MYTHSSLKCRWHLMHMLQSMFLISQVRGSSLSLTLTEPLSSSAVVQKNRAAKIIQTHWRSHRIRVGTTHRLILYTHSECRLFIILLILLFLLLGSSSFTVLSQRASNQAEESSRPKNCPCCHGNYLWPFDGMFYYT